MKTIELIHVEKIAENYQNPFQRKTRDIIPNANVGTETILLNEKKSKSMH